ncbi:FtsX-like permease family protein [Actinoplanes sp. M2I2]|uniref:FtsX-like permease family protein n=1 Tax=Actinoplanes sp. M2I2 TaxID=1734444 RepID=UPI0020229514|nr:FtsX-like permease family protein [Actinoplanes sp. M2I2]
MTIAMPDRPLALGTGNGGMAARRAVARWAWRLFRREWRQQAIVITLLLLAVAASTIGLAVAGNAPNDAWMFGAADHIVTVDGTGAQRDADLAQLRSNYGTVEVIEHANKVPVPGSADGVDLRAQDPNGPYGRSMLRLDRGRWPQGPGEIAVTDRVLKLAGLHLGGAWNAAGRPWTVVGVAENPLNLNEPFALVAPGRLGAAVNRVDALLQVPHAEYIAKPRPDGVSTQRRNDETDSATTLVLVLATVGLVFVGLLSVAGFHVMAQRRLRALGMLGAIGASHRHIRLVMLANGLAVGGGGALAGACVGVAGWVALSPVFEPLLGHRIDRFDLPWGPLLLAVALATVTAVLAAWWPARAAARIPVVAALSARPAPPRPAHRFAAVGVLLLAVGLTGLYLSQQSKALYILSGVLITALALLLLAPVGVATIGAAARHAPLAARIAMRDLARYQARSGAALAAIALAIGIAAMVALSAAVTVAKTAAPTGGAIPADQMIIWLSAERMSGPVPSVTTSELDGMRRHADTIAAELHATVLPLTGGADPNGPVDRESGGRAPTVLGIRRDAGPGEPGGVTYRDVDMVPIYVATPGLLAHYGIEPAGVGADTDVLTPLASLDGYDMVPGGRGRGPQPVLQHVTLPDYQSLPNVLFTQRGMDKFGLTEVPVGFLIDAPAKLTAAQVDAAQQLASTAGLYVESRPTGADETRLAAWFTAAGIAVALGVLAMTVGLIRSETARDLRTLAAAGARRRTRRALTAATAGSLALTGGIIGTACTYLALLAWYHKELQWLAHPPLVNLAAILVGLPVIAYIGGWVLTGRETSTVARRPLD